MFVLRSRARDCARLNFFSLIPVQNNVERFRHGSFDIDLPVVPHPGINQCKKSSARGQRGNRRLCPPPKLATLLPPPDNCCQQIDQIRGLHVVLAEQARPREHFAHHQPHHVGMTHRALGQHLERHPKRRGRAPAICTDCGRQLVVGALAVFDQQRFLGRKVQKKSRARDVGAVADIFNCNRIETAPQEQIHRGIVDIGAGTPLLPLAPGNGRRGDGMNNGAPILSHITRLQSIKRPRNTKQGHRRAAFVFCPHDAPC